MKHLANFFYCLYFPVCIKTVKIYTKDDRIINIIDDQLQDTVKLTYNKHG